ncbi:hypothetical protein Cri9333_1730 [Crinalium epipsammum PCC 9333]|uniref:Molecular chaperone DnaJ n=1 Tax=Crinalium epipsammum PCC 9333 TaxID=1173022 RepID=K9VZN3_9CYAN|nr:hypothetical protein [Crinalium epipsammum]AFZ12615.1 hypothetical protein Cri9333_1730 [Crinalium epipsammum PCC 9333]
MICDRCEGVGTVEEFYSEDAGSFNIPLTETCPDCYGSGETFDETEYEYEE